MDRNTKKKKRTKADATADRWHVHDETVSLFSPVPLQHLS